MAKGFGGRGMPGMGGVNMNMIKQELQAKEYTFAAGGGVGTATVNGQHQVTAIAIDPEAVDPEDVEMLQDLVVAAVNGALQAADSEMQSAMQQVTGGLGLPF